MFGDGKIVKMQTIVIKTKEDTIAADGQWTDEKKNTLNTGKLEILSHII